MLLTFICPTSRPPYSITNGTPDPARPLARRLAETRRQMAGVERSSQVNGEDGSHGMSHSALRRRDALHAVASRRRGGRRTTGPSSRTAG